MTNEELAIKYAERFGIVEYEVKGTTMVYYTNYSDKVTYKVTVDLNKQDEIERKHLKKFNKKGNRNYFQ